MPKLLKFIKLPKKKPFRKRVGSEKKKRDETTVEFYVKTKEQLEAYYQAIKIGGDSDHKHGTNRDPV